MVVTVPHFTRDAIQSAVDQVISAGGGKVVLPAGTYNGSQHVQLPHILPNAQPISLVIEGECPPPVPYLQFTGMPAHQSGTILNGFGIVGPDNSGVNYPHFSSIFVRLENLTIRHVNNPQKVGIDFKHVGCCDIENVTVDNGVNPYQSIQPNNAAVFGVRLPGDSNNASVKVRNLYIVGYYAGLIAGEHADIDNLFVQSCWHGIVYPSAHHCSRVGHVVLCQCPYGVVAAGVHRLSIDLLDCEHGTLSGAAWMNPITDILDPSNQLYGELKHHCVTAGVGHDDSFVATGAANLRMKRLSTGQMYSGGDPPPPPPPSGLQFSHGNSQILQGGQLSHDNSGNQQGGQWYQVPGVVGDKFRTVEFTLSAGNYAIEQFGTTSNGNGIQRLTLRNASGAVVATFDDLDWYSSTVGWNVTKTTNQVTVPAGSYYLHSEMASKNPSANAYYCGLTYLKVI
jgi:hypothetical protein